MPREYKLMGQVSFYYRTIKQIKKEERTSEHLRGKRSLLEISLFQELEYETTDIKPTMIPSIPPNH